MRFLRKIVSFFTASPTRDYNRSCLTVAEVCYLLEIIDLGYADSIRSIGVVSGSRDGSIPVDDQLLMG